MYDTVLKVYQAIGSIHNFVVMRRKYKRHIHLLIQLSHHVKERDAGFRV